MCERANAIASHSERIRAAQSQNKIQFEFYANLYDVDSMRARGPPKLILESSQITMHTYLFVIDRCLLFEEAWLWLGGAPKLI